MRTALAATVLLLAWVLQTPVGAWSINTHMYSANLIIQDLQDDQRIEVREVVRHDDGTMGSNVIGTLPVPPDIAAAILAKPDAFRAGACGPDGYPDLYVGQSVIHPFEPGQPWRAIDWAHRVLEEARDWERGDDDKHQSALAFAAGWVVHYAGDAFGHTWVNSYAGGEWDWGNMGIVERHVTLEGYVNSKIPHTGDGTDNMTLNVPSGFIVDATLLDDDVYGPLAPAGHMRALVDYWLAFRQMERKCEKRQDEWWNPVGWAIGAVEDWLEHYRKESERALSEWVETSTVVLQCMADKHPQDIPGEYTEWALEYPFRLCPALPGQIVDVIGWLGHEFGVLMSPVSSLKESIVEYVYSQAMAGTVEKLVGAEALIGDFYPPEVRAQADAEIGVTGDHPTLDWEQFKPLYDTVALGKLTLLDNDGLDELGALLGVGKLHRGSRDNIMFDCVNSLDASNQLALYPTFRLLETDQLKEQAFRRLFMSDPYEAPPSRIDPAHLVTYLTHKDREVAFFIPVADPGNDRTRVIASIYQKNAGGGPDQRVPFFAGGLPTVGTPGKYVGTLLARYQAPRYGTYKFHLCTAEQKAGGTELLEDGGIDVQVSIVKQDYPAEFIVPPATAGQMADAVAAQRNLARMTYDAMTQALQNPNLTPQQRQQYLQAQQQAKAAMDKLATMPASPVGTAPSPGAPPPDEQLGVVPPTMIANLRRMAAGGEPNPELAALQRRALGEAKLGVGLVRGAGGPVPNATITLLRTDIYNQLKTSTGVPLVRMDQWRPLDPLKEAQYYVARGNAQGEFLLAGLADGEYQLIATAPGYGKRVQPVQITRQGAVLVELPDITASAETDATAATGSERQWTPDFALAVDPPLINYDVAQKDGSVRVNVLLRPLGNFAGDVALFADKLPPGVTASFGQNPVKLTRPTNVPLVLRARHDISRNAVLTLRAASGSVRHEVQVAALLATGRLAVKPERIVVAPGDRASVRVEWQGLGGQGQAARIALGPLPPGLSVKLETMQAHPHAQPLVLAGLTVERAQEHHNELRKIVPVPDAPAPRPLPIVLTEEHILRAPVEAPAKGLLLAPGGWAELDLVAAAGAKPGTYKIPVKIEIGALQLQEAVPVEVR
jgi:hypothetical protein